MQDTTQPIPQTYNAAPQSTQPVIVLDEEGNRTFNLIRRGLVPAWAKEPKVPYNTINAMSEEVMKKPAYREAFHHRHCLVPIDCFYEWKQLSDDPKGAKQPYAIGMTSGEPCAIAGIWEHWHRGDQTLDSFSVLTTEPNELMATIHSRMPVILQPRDYSRWLDPDPERPQLDLLRPFDAELMKAWTVSTRVGKTTIDGKPNDSPELMAPAPPVVLPLVNQASLFG